MKFYWRGAVCDQQELIRFLWRSASRYVTLWLGLRRRCRLFYIFTSVFHTDPSNMNKFPVPLMGLW